MFYFYLSSRNATSRLSQLLGITIDQKVAMVMVFCLLVFVSFLFVTFVDCVEVLALSPYLGSNASEVCMLCILTGPLSSF